MMNGFEQLMKTPCASCAHMGWSLLEDAPCGICSTKVRSKRDPNRKVSGSWYCEKHNWCFYELEPWKAEKAEAWEKRNGASCKESAVLPLQAIHSPEGIIP